jgi:hypothetical protein
MRSAARGDLGDRDRRFGIRARRLRVRRERHRSGIGAALDGRASARGLRLGRDVGLDPLKALLVVVDAGRHRFTGCKGNFIAVGRHAGVRIDRRWAGSEAPKRTV